MLLQRTFMMASSLSDIVCSRCSSAFILASPGARPWVVPDSGLDDDSSSDGSSSVGASSESSPSSFGAAPSAAGSSLPCALAGVAAVGGSSPHGPLSLRLQDDDGDVNDDINVTSWLFGVIN